MKALCHALIPCAGSGQRVGGDVPKQFLKLGQQAIVLYSLDVFLNLSMIDSVWVGISEEIQNNPSLIGLFPPTHKLKLCPTGGSTRALTVLNTLTHMLKEGVSPDDWVLVHDAARPGITALAVDSLITKVIASGASGGILATPLADTLKKSITQDTLTLSGLTIDRTDLWQAQTPQMFPIGLLKQAITKALEVSFDVTDEASAMEFCGHKLLLVPGEFQNFKVTYRQDLKMMESLIVGNQLGTLPTSHTFRIGQGYDVHRLEEGRPLILGGIEIPHHKGLLGHSDADALLHAITDALLGAAGLGDIGQHFPDTDPQLAGADSANLLDLAYAKVTQLGFTLVNLDATIISQQPKLMPHLPKMTQRIAQILKVPSNVINLKAKTNEGLGYLGEGHAIETQAIVLIDKIN